ncbi:MAG: hypothetical protein LBB50_02660, partial [Oscillospiraceae bacterium]|jgi:hypothetical protein|nr:hypothetical protein [Oscillospiraceae bacterium]
VADVLPVTRTNLRYKVLVIWNGAAELRTARGLLLYVALPVLGAALLAGCVIAICGAVRRKKRRATRVDTQQDDEAAPWVPDTQQDDEAAPWVPGTQQDDEAAPQAPGTQQSDEAAPRVQRVQFDDDDDELLLQTTLLVAEVERQRKAAKKTKTKNADKEDLEWIKNYLK